MKRAAAIVLGGAAAFVVFLVLIGVVGAISDPSPAEDVGVDAPIREVDVVVAEPPAEPFPDPPPAIDGLRDLDTRLVRVELRGRVTLHQCRADAADARACTPGVVAAGEDVVVEFRRRIGAIDCAESACVLAAVSEGVIVHRVPLVFGGPARAASVTVHASDLERGDSVQARLEGFPASARGAVTICEETSRHRRATCRSAGAVPFEATIFGDATVEIDADCDRSHRCAVGVIGSPVVATYAELRFATPSGSSVPGGRAVGGLVVFGTLLAAALLLVRRTDWTPPGGDPFAGVTWGPDPFAGINLDDDVD